MLPQLREVESGVRRLAKNVILKKSFERMAAATALLQRDPSDAADTDGAASLRR